MVPSNSMTRGVDLRQKIHEIAPRSDDTLSQRSRLSPVDFHVASSRVRSPFLPAERDPGEYKKISPLPMDILLHLDF